MRYLTVTADYQGTGLRDDSGELSPDSLELPSELIQRIANWVENYQPIIKLDEAGRSRQMKEIMELDEIGLAIARAVKKHFGEAAKVQYFSEGRLLRMPV
jgi:hypothetical protein